MRSHRFQWDMVHALQPESDSLKMGDVRVTSKSQLAIAKLHIVAGLHLCSGIRATYILSIALDTISTSQTFPKSRFLVQPPTPPSHVQTPANLPRNDAKHICIPNKTANKLKDRFLI